VTNLAPHLPLDQLTRAFDIMPEDKRAFLEILARSESFLDTDSGIFIGFIRSSLTGSGRSDCLYVIAGTASSLLK
jgi:hypothetical protein